MKYLAIPFVMLFAGSAFAVQQVNKSVDVTATIPTDTFYVQPEGSWMGAPQDLTYNVVTGTLTPFAGERFVAKSTTGAIQGRLDSPAKITSGSSAIDLNIKVNGVPLSTTAADIVPLSEMGNQVFMPFEISAAAAPSGGYTPGNYAGTVDMTFETPLVVATP